jgi:hypothetical protein
VSGEIELSLQIRDSKQWHVWACGLTLAKTTPFDGQCLVVFITAGGAAGEAVPTGERGKNSTFA